MERDRTLAFGALLYAAAGFADARLTLAGLKGDLSLEGNPVMRAVMARLGPACGVGLEKTLVGAAAVLIAVYGEREIRRRADWIWRVPMTPWARDWMRRGERSWIAFIPLYGAALFQAAAAAAWLYLAR